METFFPGSDRRNGGDFPFFESNRLEAQLVDTRAFSSSSSFPLQLSVLRQELLQAAGSRWPDGPDRDSQLLGQRFVGRGLIAIVEEFCDELPARCGKLLNGLPHQVLSLQELEVVRGPRLSLRGVVRKY